MVADLLQVDGVDGVLLALLAPKSPGGLLGRMGNGTKHFLIKSFAKNQDIVGERVVDRSNEGIEKVNKIQLTNTDL